MTERNLSAAAIDATAHGLHTYIKFLSANDTGLTGGHQSGVLLSRRACPMIFGDLPSEHIAKRENIRIVWQGDTVTDSAFTWYRSKGELRLTRLGRGFPYLFPDSTGALFVFSQIAPDEYSAFILETDSEIDDYLVAFNLGPQDAGNMITPGRPLEPGLAENEKILEYVRALRIDVDKEFPQSVEVSERARSIQEDVYDHSSLLRTDPDFKLVDYTRIEFSIFRALEAQAYGSRIQRGFDDVESFVELANTVLNRRKSRAGKSLEHHLSSILASNGLSFEEQVVTEGRKKPDFIFPSGAAYHDLSFPAEKLIVLAAKTTCKDRWRQILNEADRNKDGVHYLATLQQGNSEKQLEEMLAENVQLVVPRQYIKAYPPRFRDGIWSVRRFIDFAREMAA